jgi:restriction system protein
MREAERARRAYERAQAVEEKDRKRLYLQSRVADVEARNEELDAFVASLESLLAATLDVDDFLDFEALKEEPDVPPFQPGALATPEPAPAIELFMPPKPSGVGKFLPGAKAKYEQAVEAAREEFSRAAEAQIRARACTGGWTRAGAK